MFNECGATECFTFVSPVDGDILNEFDGRMKGLKGRESLEIKVVVTAPAGSRIKINGVPAAAIGVAAEIAATAKRAAAERDCGASLPPGSVPYEAVITLDGYRNTIAAVEESSGRTGRIVVYWLKNGTGKYRISTDDNIWFLKDIAENCNRYESIFDNPYLRVFKEVHDLFGSKVHFNLFYQTEGFNLSQMPDQFKGEWQANADWIRLTFHSLQEFPDNPYCAATYDEIIKDYQLITNEIVRFAGEELLSPVTTVHWGNVTIPAARALRTLGIKGLVGYFTYDGKGEPLASYYLDNRRIDHAGKRDYWKDNCEDILFVRHDIVLNSTGLDRIVTHLDNLKKDPHRSGIMELLIHEQYFYEHYFQYQPDFRDKVVTAARWATENGYEPAFWNDVLFE